MLDLLVREKLQLAYLFGARLTGGRTILQTESDRCPTDPKRTAYWDLVAKDPSGQGITWPDGRLVARWDIERFWLEGRGHTYLVDLRDGTFRVDGRRIRESNGQRLLEPPGSLACPVQLGLIYFRRRRHHRIIGTGAMAAPSECEYHFGWRALNGDEQTVFLV